MKKKAHLFLKGRLGNQMFQYAFAYSLQLKGYVDEVIVHLCEQPYDISIIGFDKRGIKYDYKDIHNFKRFGIKDIMFF